METPERKFKQGDRVTWTEVKRSGTGISLSTKEAEIHRVLVDEAVVKYRNGRITFVPLDGLRHAHEKTGVHAFVEDLAKASFSSQ